MSKKATKKTSSKLPPFHEVCPFCQAVFSGERSNTGIQSEYKNHVRKHIKAAGIDESVLRERCRFCEETFANRAARQGHERRAHPHLMTPVPTINVEDHIITSKALEELEKEEEQYTALIVGVGIRYRCFFCNCSFESKNSRTGHARVSHPAELANRRKRLERMKEGVHYTCKLCGRVYKTKGGCARHIREDHRFAAGSSPQQDEAEEESEELSSEEEDNLPVQYPTPITVYLDPSTPFGRARQIIQAAKRRRLGV